MQFDNPFSVTSINPETFNYPKVEIKVWSNVFGDGGSVDVEAKTETGSRIVLHSEKIEENRNVADEREQAQELADDWNEDLQYNWDNEILRCYKYVLKYQQKKVDEFDKEVTTLNEYKKAVELLEAKEEK